MYLNPALSASVDELTLLGGTGAVLITSLDVLGAISEKVPYADGSGHKVLITVEKALAWVEAELLAPATSPSAEPDPYVVVRGGLLANETAPTIDLDFLQAQIYGPADRAETLLDARPPRELGARLGEQRLVLGDTSRAKTLAGILAEIDTWITEQEDRL